MAPFVGWDWGKDDALTKEHVLLWFCSDVPTDPETLNWEPLLGIFRNTLRLRMNVTRENISEQLIEAYRTQQYQQEDTPEVAGLLRVLDRACSLAGVGYRVEKGSREMQSGWVVFFEPYKIHLSFRKAKLALRISSGELQWILRDARKEPAPGSARLEQLKGEILNSTGGWIRNGNRLE